MNREILEKPFMPEQIKRRQGTNGDVLDYIEGCAVIQRLNECFEAEWIFEIQEHRVYDDEVVVLGKLTAQGVAKSQFGKSRITRAKKDNSIISLGDDLKAAATDCLKKCATLFGVGLHENIVTASLMAVLSAVNRALQRGLLDDSMPAATAG